MTTPTAKPRHRAAPRPVPILVMHLVLWLGVLCLFVPSPWDYPLAAAALAGGLAYFVQRLRLAAWIATTGADRELGR